MSKSSWWSSRHRKYKYLDKKSNLDYDLTLEQAKALMSLPCFYCCKPESRGLDRISNNLGHKLTNVVPCCGTCNLMLASTPWAAKLEMRESLRSIREKGLLGDWKPPYLTEPQPQASEKKKQPRGSEGSLKAALEKARREIEEGPEWLRTIYQRNREAAVAVRSGNHDAGVVANGEAAVNRFVERAEAAGPPPTSIMIGVDVSESNSRSALWIQCTQCSWGQEITNEEVSCGDFHDKQGCPECCLGPCLIEEI